MIEVPARVKDALRDGRMLKNYRFNVLNDDGTVDFTIDNDALVSESVKIDERMCTGNQLKFGLCEGSSLEFQYFDNPNITGRQIQAFIDVQYVDADNDVQWYEIPMGFFTVDQCPMQFSTGIRKVTAYNKLKSAYLDEKCNDEIIEAATRGDKGRSGVTSIGSMLQEALEGYAVEPEFEMMPNNCGMDNKPISRNYTHDYLRPLCKKKPDGTFVYIDDSPIDTLNPGILNIWCWVLFLSPIHTYVPFNVPAYRNRYSRTALNKERYLELYDEAIARSGLSEYYILEYNIDPDADPVFTPVREYFLKQDSIHTHMSAERISPFAAADVAVLSEDGDVIKTPYLYLDDTYSFAYYQWLLDDMPINFVVDTLYEAGTTTVRTPSDVVDDHTAEWSTLPAYYSNIFNTERILWAELRVDNTADGITFTQAQAEALPDVTLRELQSAVFETACQYGQLDRVTDLFCGVDLNRNRLLPADDLYPANDLYPQGSSSRANKSMYQKLWTDSQGVQSFRYLIITYKGLDENQQEVEKTLQRTVNADGTTDYNMSDNWLFKNLVWSDADVGTYADAMVLKMQNVTWFPFEMWCAGLPYIETGDELEISNSEGTYTSYVLQRQLNGIQNLQDTFIDGELDIF